MLPTILLANHLYIYSYKQGLALSKNLPSFICRKTQPTSLSANKYQIELVLLDCQI